MIRCLLIGTRYQRPRGGDGREDKRGGGGCVPKVAGNGGREAAEITFSGVKCYSAEGRFYSRGKNGRRGEEKQ